MNQHQVMRAKLMLVYAFDGIRLGSCDFYFSCFNFFFLKISLALRFVLC